MPKELFLVRHAKSSWDYPGLSDIERPLNERGLSDAPKMARHMSKRGFRPDLLISSPAARALTTALFFKKQLDMDGEDLWVRDQIYEAPVSAIFDLVKTLPENINAAAVFGHNPCFTLFANHFKGGGFANIPTCGVVHLRADIDAWPEFSPKSAEVIAHYFPREI